jgi:uncharacterized protein (UPF0276 family)
MADLADIKGVGLGLKRELIPQIQRLFNAQDARDDLLAALDFVEIAPENWISAGGKSAADLAWFTERFPISCHGLCLSLGGPDPLNVDFLKQVKQFLNTHKIPLYSEHLSYCSDIHNGKSGYLYDLLPIPFTEEAVHYVATRIRQTQDILGRRIAVENTSFYVQAPINEMDEITFINAVISEADCDLHLDLNNIYVNSVNFGFDASGFLAKIPANRIVYAHIAGHLKISDGLLVDTHGADIIDPVWSLLEQAYAQFGIFPTLLERDTNIPPLAQLMPEINQIAELQAKWTQNHDSADQYPRSLQSITY